MLLIFENFGGKHKGTPNLKILRSKHKKDSRKPWRFTRTPRTKERTPNLKFLENQTKIFENQREINKKTPNFKFGTKFNREIIIFLKNILKKKSIPNCHGLRPML